MEHPHNKLLPAQKPAVDSRWADGLRGIASLFVVSSHLTLCFARTLVPPSITLDGPSRLFQRPFLRLVGQGNAAVAVFFVLLGYVNSLKTIQQSRSGNVKDALSSLANSSFRRTGRLVFPAAAITCISWFLCQLGFFGLARQSNAYWLIATTPHPSPSWYQAVKDLLHELVYTWVSAENRYDQPQWALRHLFKGSMCIYVVLLATCNTTPLFRLFAEIVLYIWSWISGDGFCFLNVFAGMILAELSYFAPIQRPPSKLRELLSYGLVILGLYLCSYPDRFAEQTPWSRQLLNLGLSIFPTGSLLGRYWPALGAQTLSLGILTSPSLRRAFSSKWLHWLGGLSYSLYLLHGTFIRSILTYMIFGPMVIFSAERVRSDLSTEPLIAQPSDPLLGLIILIFTPILLLGVHAWSVKIEPIFAKMTADFEKFARSFGSGRRWGDVSASSPRENGSVLPTSVRKY